MAKIEQIEQTEQIEQYTTVIKPKTGWFDINLKEVWKYKDLIGLFVKRTFTSHYKQTVLGPLWAIIQPFITTVLYTIIFGNLAGLNDSGVPSFLFFMSANIVWTFFAGCVNATSSTFTANAGIFGKVYFPRLVTPISTILSEFITFAVQFLFFVGFMIYYGITGASFTVNIAMLLMPLFLIQTALLGLGFGVILSSLTTKYRDLTMLIGFGIQLWMYISPVVYSASIITGRFKTIFMLNPIAPILEYFRYAFLGVGVFDIKYILISWAVTLIVLFFGVMLFSRVEKTFMDTV